MNSQPHAARHSYHTSRNRIVNLYQCFIAYAAEADLGNLACFHAKSLGSFRMQNNIRLANTVIQQLSGLNCRAAVI